MSYYQDGANAAGNGQDARGTSGIPGKDDDRKLFVGGLSRQTTDRELREYFSKFGDIESITVKVDPFTGQSRGFAFIVFNQPKAIDQLLSGGDHYICKKKVDPKRVSKKVQQGKIFVGGLNQDITDTDIKEYFGQYGKVVEVQTPFDKVKNQRKGFCFVTFEAREMCWEALKKPKQTIKNKEVDVKKVKLNPETMMMGVGGGRGGGSGSGGGMGRGRGDMRGGWPAPQPYGGYGGYGQDPYGPGYGGYDGYDYGSYNDYSGGYGYEGSGPQGGGYGTGAKRGAGRQFQRHQPY